MLLVIDNYDSFTYNLVQYLGELGAVVEVRRNDEVTVDDIGRMRPHAIVLSPGPCTPAEAGATVDVVRCWGPEIPMLGVCLGHQAIGEAFGGRVIHAPTLMHGKTSRIRHDEKGVFEGVPQAFVATRYHSLVLEVDSLPDDLEPTAWSEDGVLMGLRHRNLPLEGVQFHPESVLTEEGGRIVGNWLRMVTGDRYQVTGICSTTT
jgi:anthranilate synthase component II